MHSYPVPLQLRPPLRHGPGMDQEVAMVSDTAEPIERWTAKLTRLLLITLSEFPEPSL